MVDIEQAILELETLNDNFDVPFYEIRVAIKIMKMWQAMSLGCKHNYTTTAIMQGMEERYFPKPETKREKITNIIQAVYNTYVYRGQGCNKERDKIIKILEKLRDEEEK